ncbi:hypothetical protein F5Y15DRAFT_430214 [Xylariaceae sp. FL0016]|nr:hypothetical protein F5Y15DRAFT_430214 [Xylariaceae sp. FL0016]
MTEYPRGLALYTQSTISQDDTKGPESRESRILTNARPADLDTSRYESPIVHSPFLDTNNLGPPGQVPPPLGPPRHLPSTEPRSSRGRNPRQGRSSMILGSPRCPALFHETRRDASTEASHNGNRTWQDDLRASRHGISPVPFEVKNDKSPDESPPNSSHVADDYLNFDILDPGCAASQYVTFLLDTIHDLQFRIRFTNTQKDGLSKAAKQNESTEFANSSFIELHRVYCQKFHHFHNLMVYEDVPTLTLQKTVYAEDEDKLCGKVPIPDLETYLRSSKFKDMKFVVFKEYQCCYSSSPFERDSLLDDLSSLFEHEISDTMSPRNERLRILSPMLERAIDAIAECKQGVVSVGESKNESYEMQAPYYFFFHHRHKLKQLADNNTTYGPSVKSLLTYLDTNFQDQYLEAEKCLEKEVVTESCIEKLYRPNQLIISNRGDTHSAKVLDEWPIRRFAHLVFSGWQWQYDGRKLTRKKWYDKLNLNFLDEKEISSLPVYPIEDRGIKFWSTKSQRLVEYSGWDKHHNYSYVSLRAWNSGFSNNNLQLSEFDNMPSTIAHDADLTDEQLLLLPSTTHGYSLREKKWVSINIDQTSEVLWNKNAFKRLVLEEETKDLLRALIDVRMSDSKNLKDLVAGKGNVRLLTSMSSPNYANEIINVAEFAEKPLYRVTCGDIGTTPTGVEHYLETVLYLGKIWDCVLLLDEADVFLEERSVSDLHRNSLVSIFLRVLEFYEGIMILTTNRVGTFVEAFQSRTRVALPYEPITHKSRKAIWRNFFEMLEEDDEEIKVNIRDLHSRLTDLASFKMNGRQIRNVLLTARQMALHRHESLEWKHLSQVLKLSDTFNKYIQDVRGHSDEDWAKSQALR